MLSGRATACILAGLGGLAFCVLVLSNPEHLGNSQRANALLGGLLFGTFFAAVALASAWTALGLEALVRRALQSIAALVLALAAMVLCLVLGVTPNSQIPAFVGIFGTIAIAQWLVIAALFWVLLTRRSVLLRSSAQFSPAIQCADQQFGIREVLIVTAATALLLGSARWLLQAMPSAPAGGDPSEALLTFGFLAICNLFVTVPLLLAVLLRRFALVSTLVAVVFVAVVTACEISALNQKMPANMRNTDQLLIWVINYTQATWVLLALGTLRAGGYRLAVAKKSEPREPA